MNFSFEEIMKTIYRINNIISYTKSILLIRVNTNIFDDSQIAFLREELMDIPSRRIEDVGINDDLYDILVYIYNENKMNAIVSFNKISNRFLISKVTTGKRLNTLENIGLITIKKSGRSKTLQITKKGEVLLNKRELI
jgi:DNA-binding MarR family transcriptional regulator